MRVGILTFCYTVNYGAELQAYALENALNSFDDVNAELIDYKSTAIYDSNKPVSVKNGKNLKQIVKYFFAQKCAYERWKKFRKFDVDHIIMSQAHFERDNGINTDSYDCIVIGSDQVWNMDLTKGDTNFFLPDIVDRKKICSYAASFGYSVIPEKYIKATKHGIDSIPQITVREKNGEKIVNELCGKKAEVVLDPTLLLKPSDWLRMTEQNNKNKNPFLLLYLVDPHNMEMWDYVEEYAKANNLDILWITPRRNIGTPGKKIRSAGPLDFIDMIYKADLIVTGSFHAVCFSLQFSKKFVYVMKDKSKSSRVLNLFQLLEIENHTFDNNIKEFVDLDYYKVQERLEVLRKNSLHILHEMILNSANGRSMNEFNEQN